MSSHKILRLRDYRAPDADGIKLSLAEVCARLGVQPAVVYALKHHGYLNTIQDGKRIKYLSFQVDGLDPRLLRAAIRAAREAELAA